MSRPFIPVPDVASVELIYRAAGEVVENVFYVQKGSPYSLSDLQALRGTVDTYDSTTWKLSRNVSVTLQRIRTKARDSSSGATEDYTLPTPRPGTQTGAPLPNNVTFAFKLATGHAGRSFRGRWYLVGMDGNFLSPDANHLSTTTAAFLLSWLNGWITTLASAGHTVGVVSYRSNKTWRTTGLFTPALNYTIVDYNLDSMRRRLTGRGRP